MVKSKKSDQTRTRIMKSTLRLFIEKGFEQTTMRDIAEAADMSVGAAYYHFRNKDDLVLAFYAQTGDESRQVNASIIENSRDFKTRFQALLNFKFKQMTPYRSFIGVLARAGADPKNHLSPFSPETKAMRDEAIELIDAVIHGSNLKVARSLRPHLPRILWLYQMGLIFYWIHDDSDNQERTQKLLELSLGMILKLLKLSNLPLFGSINNSAIQLLQYFETTEEK